MWNRLIPFFFEKCVKITEGIRIASCMHILYVYVFINSTYSQACYLHIFMHFVTNQTTPVSFFEHIFLLFLLDFDMNSSRSYRGLKLLPGKLRPIFVNSKGRFYPLICQGGWGVVLWPSKLPARGPLILYSWDVSYQIKELGVICGKADLPLREIK